MGVEAKSDQSYCQGQKRPFHSQFIGYLDQRFSNFQMLQNRNCLTALNVNQHFSTSNINKNLGWWALFHFVYPSHNIVTMSVLRGNFHVQTPLKWIASCYKSLEMHKNMPEINENSQQFSGYIPLIVTVYYNYTLCYCCMVKAGYHCIAFKHSESVLYGKLFILLLLCFYI